MPKRTDIHKILIIGAGPIIISQGCEFDYSGTQACKALKEEGYEVVLVNSNPATIMTDPDMADRTYIEPITPEIVAKIIERERPCALLPTLGGQTGLNTAIQLAEKGVLEKYGVEMIGATIAVHSKGRGPGLVPKGHEQNRPSHSQKRHRHGHGQCRAIAADIGFPIIMRPSFTLGGTGGGVAYNRGRLGSHCQGGLDASMIPRSCSRNRLSDGKNMNWRSCGT